jgi:hypothetical protein
MVLTIRRHFVFKSVIQDIILFIRNNFLVAHIPQKLTKMLFQFWVSLDERFYFKPNFPYISRCRPPVSAKLLVQRFWVFRLVVPRSLHFIQILPMLLMVFPLVSISFCSRCWLIFSWWFRC